MQNQGTIWSAGIGPRRGCAPKIVLTGRKEEDGMDGGWECWTHRNGTLGLNRIPTLAGNQRSQNVASGDGDDNNERGARNCLPIFIVASTIDHPHQRDSDIKQEQAAQNVEDERNSITRICAQGGLHPVFGITEKLSLGRQGEQNE